MYSEDGENTRPVLTTTRRFDDRTDASLPDVTKHGNAVNTKEAFL